MSELSISIENCYGIKKLTKNFDFSEGNTHIIYAPNGSMKSSLAKVFKDIKEGSTPSDRIFSHRKSAYSVTLDTNSIDAKDIVVVDPYVDDFDNERVNTLLATAELKSRYDKINVNIQEKLDDFMSALNKRLQTKDNPARELYAIFPGSKGNLIDCLLKLNESSATYTGDDFSWIDYLAIFNDKTVAFLQAGDTKELLEEYSRIFNELIEKSHYFRKGGFNHNSALDVSKDLSNSGFFAARHSVVLADNEDNKVEITGQKAFDQVISEERNSILGDNELKKRFDKIDKAITKNVDLRLFRKYLEEHPTLSNELNNIDELRVKIISSFAKLEKDKLGAFNTAYSSGRKDIEVIIKDAKEQRTAWENVIQLFNDRFSVPFEIKIENKEDVILKNETASLVFQYKDGEDEKTIGRDDLITVLSIGERRAYHLLNVIYEIENRHSENKKTIVIIDDIADSFDYKNKYAIIQYLKDVARYPEFYQIILTHNFDFYRTVQSRLYIGRTKNCHMTVKEKNETKIVKAEYLNPFSYYRENINKNDKIAIAAIPFIRNLVEYTEGKESLNYAKLTALLHIKKETDSILISDYFNLVNIIFRTSNKYKEDSRKVVDVILATASECNDEKESINLEKKIILSIAIRLLTERYIIYKLGFDIINDIDSDQTIVLIRKYLDLYPYHEQVKQIFETVVLITPENIHLNAFMYEPLLDISDHHLCNLYSKIVSLK